MPEIRIDKFVASATALSRSAATREIRRGRVTVEGTVIKQPSFYVDADSSSVCLCGEAIKYKRHIYLVMNKPKGVITASRDKLSSTVLDLIPEGLRRKDLSAVGRLDKDTTGLLILTDDGDFTHKCISPKSMIPKKYIAVLDKDITDEDIKAFSRGIVLADNTKCMPAKLERIEENKAAITIYEGKYHQIKRMFGVVGAGVNELKRVSVGDYLLPDDLHPGQVIEAEYGELFTKVINYCQKSD